MTTVWISLKKSLHCTSEPSDVHDPSRPNNNSLISILTKKTATSTSTSTRSGCSRYISNLRDVIHGSKRHLDKQQPICNPRSIGSSELMNPIAHEVVLGDSRCELKIIGFTASCTTTTTTSSSSNETAAAAASTFVVGTLTPGTPGPGGSHAMPHLYNSPFRGSASATPSRKSPSPLSATPTTKCSGRYTSQIPSNVKASYVVYSNATNRFCLVTCPKCGD